MLYNSWQFSSRDTQHQLNTALQATPANYFAFLINVVHHPLLFSYVCLKKGAIPLFTL